MINAFIKIRNNPKVTMVIGMVNNIIIGFTIAFKKAKVKELKSKNKIVIDMGDNSFQYVYYDDSSILKRLLFCLSSKQFYPLSSRNVA